MPKFRVRTHILDRVDTDAGFFDNGTPKKVVEHKQGDIIEFPGYDEHFPGRVDRLVELRAIEPVGKTDESGNKEPEGEKGGGTPPLATTGGAGGTQA